jgi:hypothetical protein
VGPEPDSPEDGEAATAARRVVRGTLVTVDNYRVAAYPAVGGRGGAEVPEGKSHAYLDGANATACGFGLGQMRTFGKLSFKDQPPSVRCSICDRRVRAASR